jgi:hypothetical protein
MTGYHTRRVRPPEAEDPERIAIREALAVGKAVHDQRRAPGLNVDDLVSAAGNRSPEVRRSSCFVRSHRDGCSGNGGMLGHVPGILSPGHDV